MKNVLGLDIGTSSIGAALLKLPEEFEDYGKEGKIEWLTSRIVPFDTDYTKAFSEGKNGSPQVKTPAANRRQKRGSRRLKHRYKLRRTRLIRVFKTLGWLPNDFLLDNPKHVKERIADKGNFSFRISDDIPISDESYREFYREFGYNENELKKIIEEIHFRRNSKGKKKYSEIKLLPEDWVVYYLRKKALTKPITKEELVRIIYILNQRRGFKSSRKDLKDTTVLRYEEFAEKLKNKEQYKHENYETQFVSITKVKEVIEVDKEGKKGKKKFKIVLDDQRIEPYEEERKEKPDWEGKEYTFLVTQKLEKGKLKQNKPQLPKEDDWTLCTTALDNKMGDELPGKYFFDKLKKAYKEKRNYKIRQYPVYRWRYQKELETIWKKQCELNPELNALNTDKNLIGKIAALLYPSQSQFNGPKIKEFENHDLLHIISNDIIYYQRELKSQKSLIGECPYEKRTAIWKNEDGSYEKETRGLNRIPRTSPLFQEFRIWQDIHNIRVIKKAGEENGKKKINIDETSKYINEINKEKLFELFDSKESIGEKEILELLHQNTENSQMVITKKEEENTHRINLFANRKELKGNETKHRYRKVFSKFNFDGNYILNDPIKLFNLWHSDYSNDSSDENKSVKGIVSALGWKSANGEWKQTNNFEMFHLPLEIAQAIAQLPPFKKEYGAYSALATRKMLVVMRCGKYWMPLQDLIHQFNKDLSEITKERKRREIQGLLDSLTNMQHTAKSIKERLDHIGRTPHNLYKIADDEVEKQVLKSFLGKGELREYYKGLATYQAGYLIYGKHSEKDVAEVKTPEAFGEYLKKELPNNSLRNPIVEQVIREAMLLVRDVWKKFGTIDEIHIELGRELRNNAKERERISQNQNENFEEKQKARLMLKELLNESFEHYDEIGKKIISSFTVKPNPDNPLDIERFRLWKSQSGLSDEYISKKLKDEKIPTEQQVKKYILWISQNCRSPYTGKIIPLSKLFDANLYEIEHIIPRSKMKNDAMSNLVISEWVVNKAKGDKLAANFISDSNGKCTYGDTEYTLLTYDEYVQQCESTFKFQRAKLKNLLATEPPDDFIQRQINDTRYIGRKLAELLKPVTKDPNGVVFTIGSITSELKQNWGLNRVWNDIVKPRFERLEKILDKRLIYFDEEDKNKYHFDLSLNPHLEQEGTKRLDHRHHALDAVIIAATTREHIRFLNTLTAADTDAEKKKYFFTLCKGKIRDFKQPWDNFTLDVKNRLLSCVVSFKESAPIITNPYNKYEKWEKKNGKWQKVSRVQEQNERWKAVRRSMFKEPIGTVWIKKVKEVGIKEAIKIQAYWNEIKNNPELKRNAAYIYDDHAQKSLERVIDELAITGTTAQQNEQQIDKYLQRIKSTTNKNGKKKTVYQLDGTYYERIKIAEFIRYKAKRMSLDKKEYVENLTIQKMCNDFPNFILEKAVLEKYPSRLKKLQESGYEIDKNRKNNPVNRLFLEHILEYNNEPKEAFSAEGIDKLNKKAIERIGKPIKSVTRLDGIIDKEDMFRGAVYETDKGSNVYFVMYENKTTNEREYLKPTPSISVLKALEKENNIDKIAPEREGFIRIVLSPDDLVYVPTVEEIQELKKGKVVDNSINWNDTVHIVDRIYQTVSFTGNSCLFRKYTIADIIQQCDTKLKIKGEIDWHNKSEMSFDETPVKIKETCIKIKINRLGNIKPIIHA
ncbi:MAG: type II CRISPR RNA-guided endonuclease Cas9 [Bacteroidota bacterium]